MPADPVSAGRKGGQSRSPAKLAACRRNGFQRVYDAQQKQTEQSAKQAEPNAAFLISARPE